MSLQTLPSDCHLELLSHLSLPDCIRLRATCKSLKAAAEEHFRLNVRSLPVLLSARYSSDCVAKYNQYHVEHLSEHDTDDSPMNGSTHRRLFELTTFGSGSSQWRMWDFKDSFVRQDHFRSRYENYLVVSNGSKLLRFLRFITKYLPGITKFALLIDLDDHFWNVSEVLKVYRKQLKVLKLETTLRLDMRSTYRFDKTLSYSKVSIPQQFYRSIESLPVLEELHYFTKTSQAPEVSKYMRGNMPIDREIFVAILRKIRVLHYAYKHDPYPWHTEPWLCSIRENDNLVCENLQEFASTTIQSFIRKNIRFPRLEKCINFGNFYLGSLNPRLMPVLRDIRTNYLICFDKRTIKLLDSFPNLEQIDFRTYIFPETVAEMQTRTVKLREINDLNGNYLNIEHELEIRSLEVSDIVRNVTVRKPKLAKLLEADVLIQNVH